MLQLICFLLLNIAYTQWVLKIQGFFTVLIYFIVQVILIWQTIIIPNEMLQHLAL